jgi:tripartite-type tricarboxylate transporter receptor subunit TctC
MLNRSSERRFPKIKRASRQLVVQAMLACLCLWPACAETYPSRYIRLIVGAGLDSSARIIGARIEKVLGQPVIVNARPGAGGAIALQAAAIAEPDGYTLMMGTAANVIQTALGQSHLDLRKDFEPVGNVTTIKYVLVINPSVPARSLAELIEYAKANPGRLNFVSGGVGTPPHLAMETFRSMTNLDMVHVPYRDANSAMAAVIAGTGQMMFAMAAIAQPQIEAGKVLGLAVSGTERSPFAPQVRPVAEQGLPTFNIVGWNGLFAPKNVPRDVIEKLSTVVQEALQDPEFRNAILKTGYEPAPRNNPAEFAAFVEAESVKWAKLLPTLNLKP